MNIFLYLQPMLFENMNDPKMLMNIGIIGLVFIVMYFLIIRPQRKKQKETEMMLKNIKKGDKVTSIGGIKGVVHQVKEATVVVKVDDNTKLEFTKNAIGSVDLPKDAPAVTNEEEKPRLFGKKKSE